MASTAYKKGIIIMPFRVHKPPIMVRSWNLMKYRSSFRTKVRTCFIEAIDDANRQKYEVLTVDEETGVRVEAIFVATSGSL